MIVFHEGLPGAGKSYEAVLTFVLPALKEGREVYTNIRGLDSDKIAKHLGLAPVFLQGRIHSTSPDPLDGEDRDNGDHLQRQKDFFLSAGSNCLILWDEIQDFFPPSRQAVPSEWSEFVAAHRHMARDIILMGQDVRDVHSIWRRRVEQLIRFRKLTVIGKGNGYRWEIFQNKGGDKWESMQSGHRRYDKRIFSLYQSIRADSEQTHKLLKNDKNPFANSYFLKFGLPAFLIAFIWGCFTVYDVFFGDAFMPAATSQEAKPAAKPVKEYIYSDGPLEGGYVPPDNLPPITPEQPGTSAAPPKPAPGISQSPDTMMANYLSNFRAYVVGMVQSDSGSWFAQVAFYDQGNQPFLVLDKPALVALVQDAFPHPAGLQVTLNDGTQRLIAFKAAPDATYTTAGAVDSYRRATARATPSVSEPLR